MHDHSRGIQELPEIDFHKRESHVAVLDDNGEVNREIRVENANLDEIAEQYAGAQAVIKVTSNYYNGLRYSRRASRRGGC